MATSSTFLVVLLLVPLLLSLLHRFLVKKFGRSGASKHLHLPPGPRGLPIIGNLHQLGHLPHRSLWRLSRSHGPVMLLQLGAIPTAYVSSAEAAREVLKTRDLDFCTRPKLCATSKISYGNSDIGFSPYGEYWRQMRKLSIVQLFSNKRVQSFRSVRGEEIDSMIKAISSASADRRGAVINLSEMISDLSNDMTCRVAFGRKYPRDGGLKGGVHQIMREIQVLMSSLFVQDYFPYLGWIDKLTGLSNKLQKSVEELDFLYEKVIQEHLDAKFNGRSPDHQEDIVDVLLTTKSDLTMDCIKAVITDIFIAGTETASATIIWAMSELARNPRLMKKAQEEIRSVVVGSSADGRVEEGHLQQLQYLKVVIKETFRLHSPVPLLLPRESLRHTTIGGYDIPPNTRVYVNAWGIGRDPKSWGDHQKQQNQQQQQRHEEEEEEEEEEELEEFMPERFIGSSIDYQGHDFELIPFGSGRRICPGMNLAIVNIEAILASLLYHFDWEMPEGGMEEEDMDMEEAQGLVVHKKSPLFLVAKEAALLK